MLLNSCPWWPEFLHNEIICIKHVFISWYITAKNKNAKLVSINIQWKMWLQSLERIIYLVPLFQVWKTALYISNEECWLQGLEFVNNFQALQVTILELKLSHISALSCCSSRALLPVSASAPKGCFPKSSLKAMRPRWACEASLRAREVMQARYWSAERVVEHSLGCHMWNIPGSVERITESRDLTYLQWITCYYTFGQYIHKRNVSKYLNFNLVSKTACIIPSV